MQASWAVMRVVPNEIESTVSPLAYDGEPTKGVERAFRALGTSQRNL